MKTVGQILDHLDEQIAQATERALNPDRAFNLREHELRRRVDLLALRKFITSDEGAA